MSRRRIGKPAECRTYPIQLRQAISRYLPRRGLPTLSKDGKVCWTARLLAVCAILTAWGVEPTLGGRFEAGRHALARMFPSRRRAGATYQGFVAAPAKASGSLLAAIVPHLRQAVVRAAGTAWEFRGWAVFGADGSKVDAPMTEANEEGLGVAGRERAGPQVLPTVLFHVGSGLVWAWRRGAARASERSHLLDMLDTLPPNAMLLADAGFTGYELPKAIGDARRSFPIRVGANVHLLTGLYDARRFDDLVWLWPKGQRKAGMPPLALRLIRVDGGRKGTMHLLTDVLGPARLSDADAAGLYAMRWGIELLYRSLKQVMGRGKMLSGTPGRAAVELDWSVVGLWMIGLMNAQACGDLGRLSPARTLRALRAAMAGRGCGGTLWDALARAMRDPYVRTGSKTARHWPHKKTEKPPGRPNARAATAEEVTKAQEFVFALAAA